MAYVAPTTRIVGERITAAIWNQDVVDNVAFLANPPSCFVYNSGNQSISDATETTLTFDSERWDTNSMHSTSLDTGRITFNTAGIYLVQGNVRITAGNDYSMAYLSIRRDGTTEIAIVLHTTTTFNTNPILNVSVVRKFAAAQYVELRAYQDNTASAARNVLNNAESSPTFSATWLGIG